jgi:hypothetical protein
VTFDATPQSTKAPSLDLSACKHVTVCDLSGVERFLVWAVRWSASLHDDSEFADLCLDGTIARTGPLPAEVSGNDALDLPRLVMTFDPRKGGRFRELIAALNGLESAPPLS